MAWRTPVVDGHGEPRRGKPPGDREADHSGPDDGTVGGVGCWGSEGDHVFFQAGFFRGEGRSRAQGRFRTMKRDWPGAGPRTFRFLTQSPELRHLLTTGADSRSRSPQPFGQATFFRAGTNWKTERVCSLLWQTMQELRATLPKECSAGFPGCSGCRPWQDSHWTLA